MAAILFPNGKQYYALPTGIPNVGGKVYTYAAGTSTPLTTWSDAAQTVPNTNPVILDARGEALIFWNGNYKVVLRDALDNIIWTVDNVVAAPPDNALRGDLAATSGAGLVGFSHAITYPSGTLGKKGRDTVSVKDAPFNAKGDGVTDDTAAFQAAINYATSSGNKAIYIPGGNFLLTSQLTITDTDFSIFGAGKDCSLLLFNTVGGNGIVLVNHTTFSSLSRSAFTVQDLTIASNVAGAGTALKLDMTITPPPVVYGDGTTLVLSNVDIRGYDHYGPNTMYWTKGIHAIDAGMVDIRTARVLAKAAIAGTVGIHIQATSGLASVSHFINGFQTIFTETSILLQANNPTRIEGVYVSNFELVGGLWGVRVTGGPVHGLELANGHINCQSETVTYEASAAGSTILIVNGCYMQRGQLGFSGATAGYVLDLRNVLRAKVMGNFIFGDVSVAHYGVVATNGASNATIVGNTIQDCTAAGIVADNTSNNVRISANNFVNVATPYLVSGATNYADIATANSESTTSGIKHVFGTGVVTLNASGDGTFTLPQPFQNAILGAVVCNGDPASFPGDPGCLLSASTTSSLAVRVRPAVAGVMRINFHATGN